MRPRSPDTAKHGPGAGQAPGWRRAGAGLAPAQAPVTFTEKDAAWLTGGARVLALLLSNARRQDLGAAIGRHSCTGGQRSPRPAGREAGQGRSRAGAGGHVPVLRRSLVIVPADAGAARGGDPADPAANPDTGSRGGWMPGWAGTSPPSTRRLDRVVQDDRADIASITAETLPP